MVSNFDMTKFKQELNTIVNTNTCFGNKLLYDMCVNEPGQEWGYAALLADKLWLIGRAYAASPERRYQKKPENSQAVVGDGTGQFFSAVAEYIIHNKPSQNFSRFGESLVFDGSDTDAGRLAASINAVVALNDLLRNAIFKVDQVPKDEEGNYRNHLSFCSKFLHFHYPESVFITDSYSYENAKAMLSPRTRSGRTLDNLTINATVWKNAIVPKIKNVDFVNFKACLHNRAPGNDVLKEYREHCLRAYEIGCVMKQLTNEASPRAVDTFLLKLKK